VESVIIFSFVDFKVRLAFLVGDCDLLVFINHQTLTIVTVIHGAFKFWNVSFIFGVKVVEINQFICDDMDFVCFLLIVDEALDFKHEVLLPFYLWPFVQRCINHFYFEEQDLA